MPWAGLAVLASAALLLPASAWGTSLLVVTNTNDSGAGSLRQAIIDANAGGSPSTIDFNIPMSDPGFTGQWFSIAPASPLPQLTVGGTTIDGASQTAFTGDTNTAGPEIFLDGRSQVGDSPGLWIQSSSNVVEGLAVSGFPGFQIQVGSCSNMCVVPEASDGNIVRGDYLGTDPTGTTAIPGGDFGNGVEVNHGATNTVIGGTTADARNVISGNSWYGIEVLLTTGAVIEGNYIGTNAAGTAALGNFTDGIRVGISSSVTIGGTAAGAGNLVSGNGIGHSCGCVTGAGIGVTSVDGLNVEGNLIGTDATGASAIPNVTGGIVFFGNNGAFTNVVIGGTTAASRNVISGNGGNGIGNGISISPGTSGSTGIVVEGNFIGTDAAGSAALGNVGVGIGIDGGTLNTVIGGTDPGAGNVISANRVGIDMTGGSSSQHQPVGTTIQGNMIGTDATGTFALGNTAAGIGTAAAGSMLIGGAASGARNVISGNDVGINLGGAVGVIVEGNDIGTNLAGAPVPNASDGVQLGAGGNEVEANTIADNGGDGVDISSSDPLVDDTISRNSMFSNGNLGIDLNGDGVTLNNCCGHSGPNDYENFPVLTSAVTSGGHVTVVGTLDTASPHTAKVELFADPTPDPGGNWSGYGEGAVFLGSVTPAANGSFTATLPSFAPGALISATATDSAGNTSEFAQDIWLTSPAPPVVSSFSPTHGTVGTSVTIAGSGFAGATAIAFGGIEATDVSVGSDSTITATIAAGTPTGPVSVTAPGGTTASSALFYLPPTVTGFSPSNAAEHATVTVTGTNLIGATQVQLGGVGVPFSVASNGRLTFTVPTGSTGGTVHVVAPGGSATSGGSVTILAPPAISSIAPLSGPVGTTVTITGTNLGGTVGVMLGSVVTVPTSISPTSVTFTIPPGAASGHVRVLTTSGAATSTDAFTVTG